MACRFCRRCPLPSLRKEVCRAVCAARVENWGKSFQKWVMRRHFSTTFATFPHKNCGKVHIWPRTAFQPTRPRCLWFFLWKSAWQGKERFLGWGFLWKSFFSTLGICGKLHAWRNKLGKCGLFPPFLVKTAVENPVEKSISIHSGPVLEGAKSKFICYHYESTKKCRRFSTGPSSTGCGKRALY